MEISVVFYGTFHKCASHIYGYVYNDVYVSTQCTPTELGNEMHADRKEEKKRRSKVKHLRDIYKQLCSPESTGESLGLTHDFPPVDVGHRPFGG